MTCHCIISYNCEICFYYDIKHLEHKINQLFQACTIKHTRTVVNPLRIGYVLFSVYKQLTREVHM